MTFHAKNYKIIAVVFAALCLILLTRFSPHSIIHQSSSEQSSPDISHETAGGDNPAAAVSGTVFKGNKVRQWNAQLPSPSANVVGGIFKSRTPKSSCDIPIVAVTTTISNDLSVILDFKKNPITKNIPIVIAGDLKGPRPKELEKYLGFPLQTLDLSSGVGNNVYLLTIDIQNTLFPQISKLTPIRHFGRKNLGYLTAIALGACAIWDFDDDNYPILPSFFVADYLKKLKDNPSPFTISSPKSLSVNPYVLMGAKLDDKWTKPSSPIWPRGMPITDKNREEIPSLLSTDLLQGKSSINKLYKIGVIQSIANHDPDVDAIYRLTSALPVNFESKLSIVNVHPSQYSPYNGQATAFFRESFWSMYLPVTVHGRVSDIWRSYISQALMKCTGHLLTFHKPIVVQIRNSHNYQGDLNAEQPLYQQTEALISVLNQFTCSSLKLDVCLVELYIELYERNFIHDKDVIAIKTWVDTLNSLRYEFPPIKKELCDSSAKSYYKIERPIIPVSSTSAPKSSTVAVVHVDKGRVGNIPLWKSLHQHMFSDTVFYCPEAVKCRSMGTRNLHCINRGKNGGYAFQSMHHALQYYQHYDSYVATQDDIMFSSNLIRNAIKANQTMFAEFTTTSRFKASDSQEQVNMSANQNSVQAELSKLGSRCQSTATVKAAPTEFFSFVINKKDKKAFLSASSILEKTVSNEKLLLPWVMKCILGSKTYGSPAIHYQYQPQSTSSHYLDVGLTKSLFKSKFCLDILEKKNQSPGTGFLVSTVLHEKEKGILESIVLKECLLPKLT